MTAGDTTSTIALAVTLLVIRPLFWRAWKLWKLWLEYRSKVRRGVIRPDEVTFEAFRGKPGAW